MRPWSYLEDRRLETLEPLHTLLHVPGRMVVVLDFIRRGRAGHLLVRWEELQSGRRLEELLE